MQMGALVEDTPLEDLELSAAFDHARFQPREVEREGECLEGAYLEAWAEAWADLDLDLDPVGSTSRVDAGRWVAYDR